MDLQKIGACLRDLRKEKGLTQEQLAEQFNVSQRTVSRWETGTATPDLDVLLQLADFYEVDMRALLDGNLVKAKTDLETKETVQRVEKYHQEKYKAFKRIIIRLLVIIGIVLVLFSIPVICAGCKFAEPEWNAKFEEGIYGSRNKLDSYYIGNDGIYRMSDGKCLILTGVKPSNICANDDWVVCSVDTEKDNIGKPNREIYVYCVKTSEIHMFPIRINGHALILIRDTLLVWNYNSIEKAFDLSQLAEQRDLPVLWTTGFRMNGFEYRITTYQFHEYKVGILDPIGSQGNYISLVTDYGNDTHETGRGEAIIEITEDDAYVVSAYPSDNMHYAVFRVMRDGTCCEITTIPSGDEGGEIRFQFGKCLKVSDGSHILTLRKMNGWHKAEIPRERNYVGDLICVFTPDWKEYQMIDLENKKLIGNSKQNLYYIEGNTLYRTTAESLLLREFEFVENLPKSWKYIAFSENGRYTVY